MIGGIGGGVNCGAVLRRMELQMKR